MNVRRLEAVADDGAVGLFHIDTSQSGATRFGVPASRWSRLLDVLYRTDPRTYVQYVRPDTGRLRIDLIGRVDREALADQSSLRVYAYYRHIPTGVIFGSPQGCTIDRWVEEGDRLISPVRNGRSTDIPASAARRGAEVLGVPVPTVEPFSFRQFDHITFPIDAVFMWVDGSDIEWQERRNARLRELGRQPMPLAVAQSRYRDHGELRYSIRAVRRFAPWIRHVYLVTDRQRPSWLRTDHESITVVDHREFFRDVDALPTFNSHAIAAQLHRVPGLSEHYLIFNDDVILTRPVSPQAFFDSNGVAKFFLSRSTLPAGSASSADLPHEAARKRARDLVFERYGHYISRTFKHTPIAQQRSLNEMLEAEYADAFRQTVRNPFRSGEDVETASWLHNYVGYFEGRARPASMTYDYFDIGTWGGLERFRRLQPHAVSCICINDSDGEVDLKTRYDALYSVLQTHLSEASDLEICESGGSREPNPVGNAPRAHGWPSGTDTGSPR